MDQQSREIKYSKKLIIRDPIPLLQKLMVLYIAVWSLSPPLEVGNVFRLAALVCALGWFLLDLYQKLKLRKIHLMAILFIFLVITVTVVESNAEFSKLLKQISMFILVMAFIMNFSYRGRWDELKMLIPVLLVLLIIFNILTTSALWTDPTLARKIVRADDEMIPYLKSGVGGYELVYSQVMMYPAILFWTVKAIRNNKPFFALGAGWTASFILLILNAGYSIALVSTIAGTLVLFFNRRRSIVPALILTFALMLTIILLIGYVDPVRNALIEFFDGTKVAQKVEDIYNSIHGVEVADSIMERWKRYRSSLETILNYPFIGGLWFESGGGHSAILDTFAKYGLFGGIMYVKMFFHVPLELKKYARNIRELRLSNALLVVMIVVTLLDSTPYNMMFPVLIIMPVLICQIEGWGGFNESLVDSKYSPRRYLQKTVDRFRELRRMDRSDGSGPWQPR